MTAPPAEEKSAPPLPIKGLSLPAKSEPVEQTPTPEKTDEPAPAVPVASDPEPATPVQTDEPEWLSRLRAASPPVEEETKVAGVSSIPDWLVSAETPSAPASTQEPETNLFESNAVEPAPAANTGEPTWLSNLRGESSADAEPASTPAEPVATEEPSWVSQLRAAAPSESTESESDAGVPDWLQSAGTSQPAPAETPISPVVSNVAEEPDWLKPVADESPTSFQMDEGVPDWLRSVAPPSGLPTPTSEPVPVEPMAESALPSMADQDETSDEEWLRRIQSGEQIHIPMPPASVRSSSQPFAEDEIPDWLRFATPAAKPEPFPGVTPAQPIEPAQVPEWIAALKPAEEAGFDLTQGEPVETGGPLAGLRGVLPLANAIAEPHMLSQATPPTARRSGANLFESILATPTSPAVVPVVKKKRPFSISRWLIYLTLLVAVVIPLLLPPDLSSALMPISRTPAREFFEVLDKVATPNATVMLAFEYEPGVSGEMDLQARAIARYLANKRVKVATLSTFETGPQIAQRVLDQVVEPGKYEYGTQVVNLGYFAGNEAALANLATTKFSATALDYRDRKPLRPFLETSKVTSLSDAAMVIVLAGNEDTLKMWMEQVQPRGVKMAAGVSAAVEPRARAYRDAKQLLATMSGLAGAAQFEILSGKPDRAVLGAGAQNLAIVVLVLVIVVGNLAFLVTRARTRSEKK